MSSRRFGLADFLLALCRLGFSKWTLLKHKDPSKEVPGIPIPVSPNSPPPRECPFHRSTSWKTSEPCTRSWQALNYQGTPKMHFHNVNGWGGSGLELSTEHPHWLLPALGPCPPQPLRTPQFSTPQEFSDPRTAPRILGSRVPVPQAWPLRPAESGSDPRTLCPASSGASLDLSARFRWPPEAAQSSAGQRRLLAGLGRSALPVLRTSDDKGFLLPLVLLLHTLCFRKLPPCLLPFRGD